MWHKPIDSVPDTDRFVNILCNSTKYYKPYVSIGFFSAKVTKLWTINGRPSSTGEVIAWAEIEQLPDDLKKLLL